MGVRPGPGDVAGHDLAPRRAAAGGPERPSGLEQLLRLDVQGDRAAGLITVPDLLFRARGLATQNFRVFEIYFIVLVMYYVVGTSPFGIRWFERRLRVDVPKAEARTVLCSFARGA